MLGKIVQGGQDMKYQLFGRIAKEVTSIEAIDDNQCLYAFFLSFDFVNF